MADGRLFVPGELLPAAEIRRRVATAFEAAVVVDDGGDARGPGPARYFRLAGGPAAEGPPRRFGIISPMTEHFCATCNRMRLSATGALHACLAYDDAVDLRAPLRAGAEAVVRAIRQTLAGKRPGHEFNLIGLGGPRKAMVQIGG